MRARSRAAHTAIRVIHGLLCKHGPKKARELADLFNDFEFSNLEGGWFIHGLSPRQVTFCLKRLRSEGLARSEGHPPLTWSAITFAHPPEKNA